jgi:hypothetical protein
MYGQYGAFGSKNGGIDYVLFIRAIKVKERL